MSTRVIVTGASGFVGRHLLARLAADGPVVAMSRRPLAPPASASWMALPDLSRGPVAEVELPAAECMVHLAAIAHVRAGAGAAARASVRLVNGEAPAALARLAFRAGIKRFIFLSSVKALAEESTVPLTPEAAPSPRDEYGEAKAAAERGLMQVADETGIELVIVRAPLVYGPGVKGNLAQLVRWVRAGVPLPLASVENRRSLVSVSNLADLLAVVCRAPQAAGAVLHVCDAETLSTPQLIEHIARAFGVRARMFACSPAFLDFALRCIGRGGIADRLMRSLVLDDSATRILLGWRPPQTLDDGLADMARVVP